MPVKSEPATPTSERRQDELAESRGESERVCQGTMTPGVANQMHFTHDQV